MSDPISYQQDDVMGQDNRREEKESAIPIAIPSAPFSPHPIPLVTGSFSSSMAQTTSAPSKPRTPPHPTGRRQLEALASELSDRDHRVLHELALHRYLTTVQVTSLVFTGHASVDSAARIGRRTLARLQRLGLLQPLKRRVGGQRAGSSAAIWQLSTAGARIVQQARRSRYRPTEPSPRTLQHCLAVADTHIGLRALRGTATIDRVVVELEPTCWRRYTGTGGDGRWLQPDLATAIHGHDQDGEFEDRWFIEVDLATESVATLHRKCRQYADYRATGLEQAANEGTFPLVLWLLYGPRAEERGAQLAAKVQRDRQLTPTLFRYAAPEALHDVLLGDAV